MLVDRFGLHSSELYRIPLAEEMKVLLTAPTPKSPLTKLQDSSLWKELCQ